ncbi:hypothetical protein M569_04237 [Genlisea aurea]|uniref:Sas10 C-terminal domain-containing protein n=1 Tax=Genlisea aurea TaxID=192259 RepID=S8CTC9_9LAMI|nr:hypothetical protein M569_04237 [Genlisea aurea]
MSKSGPNLLCLRAVPKKMFDTFCRASTHDASRGANGMKAEAHEGECLEKDLKHMKAEVRRKGQIRVDMRKPTGSYGGEASGINAAISRSIRFKD